MTIGQAVVSGVVQGTTEFFPISSSGHLVLLQSLFGMQEPQLAFSIFLHLGTLLSIVVFFWKDIIRLLTTDRRMVGFIIIGSIPAALVGFTLKDTIDRVFAMPGLVGYMLIVTGCWLIASHVYAVKRAAACTAKKALGARSAITVGIAQAVAVMPGISRSGATIGAGILSGMCEEQSLRFSFLLAIPTIVGASFLEPHTIGMAFRGPSAAFFLAGGLTAMVTGIVSIKFLLGIIKKNMLHIFGVYCIAAGALAVIITR